jgi:hypothetical protein
LFNKKNTYFEVLAQRFGIFGADTVNKHVLSVPKIKAKMLTLEDG